MQIFRLLACLLLMAQPCVAATISLDRGPTGNSDITFVELDWDWVEQMAREYADPIQRVENTENFLYQNSYFLTNGLTPDGAGSAETETARYTHATFRNGRIFRLEGLIESGDTERLHELATPYLKSICANGGNCPYSAVLSLNSPGGSFSEAIKLAEFIKRWSLVTVVDKGDRCESACAMAFLSGHDTFEGYFAPRRFAHVTADIGIHQPIVELDPNDPRASTASPTGLFRLANLVIAEVTRLFLQTRVSIGALDRMYATPSDQMLYLSPLQLIEEKVRVFDDTIEDFRGGRSDLISYCSHRLAAKTYTASSEVVSNFQMQEDIFVTFDVGRYYVCSGWKDPEGYWRMMVCHDTENCPLWRDPDSGFNPSLDETDVRFGRLEFYLLERGHLGLREYAHQRLLLDFLEQHQIYDERNTNTVKAYRRIPIPASALPMPPELCGKLDEAHPELVRIVQQKLPTYGFDAGGVDGSLGPKTREAVQDANARIAPDAPPNNRITPALLKAMRIPQATVDRFTLCHPSYRD